MKKWWLLAVGVFLIVEGPLFQGEPAAFIGPETGFTNEVLPVLTAFHVTPPVGIESPDLFICDATLTEFLKIIICQPQLDGSCTTVGTLTSAPSGSPLQSIVFQDDKKYHVNWQRIKDYAGMTLEFRFSVADLDGPALTYTIATRANSLPIQFVVENNPLIRARVLHRQGFSATDIAQALLSEFGLGDEDILIILRDEGFAFSEIATAAKNCLQLSASRLAEIVVGWPGLTTNIFTCGAQVAGYSAEDVYIALRSVYMSPLDDAANVLKACGYESKDILNVIIPELKTEYQELIAKYGPIVYFHNEDHFRPSSVDWHASRSTLKASWEGSDDVLSERVGVDFALEDLSNRAREIHDEMGAATIWLDPDESTRPGDLDTARFYVNAVTFLPGQVGDPRAALDLQFWIFYPYNGPGTFNADIHAFNQHVWSTCDVGDACIGNVAPLGEHTADWEVMTLRFMIEEGYPRVYTLHSVFLEQHGDYPQISAGDFEREEDHVIAYSSLNGHAMYYVAGDNPTVKMSKNYDATVPLPSPLPDVTFKFLDISAQLLNKTEKGPRLNSWQCSDLVGIYYAPLADELYWTDPAQEEGWTWNDPSSRWWLDFGDVEDYIDSQGCNPTRYYPWRGWGWGPTVPLHADLREVVLQTFGPAVIPAIAFVVASVPVICATTGDPNACLLTITNYPILCTAIIVTLLDMAINYFSDTIVEKAQGEEDDLLTSKGSPTPRFRRGLPCPGQKDGEWLYKVSPLRIF